MNARLCRFCWQLLCNGTQLFLGAEVYSPCLYTSRRRAISSAGSWVTARCQWCPFDQWWSHSRNTLNGAALLCSRKNWCARSHAGCLLDGCLPSLDSRASAFRRAEQWPDPLPSGMEAPEKGRDPRLPFGSTSAEWQRLESRVPGTPAGKSPSRELDGRAPAQDECAGAPWSHSPLRARYGRAATGIVSHSRKVYPLWPLTPWVFERPLSTAIITFDSSSDGNNIGSLYILHGGGLRLRACLRKLFECLHLPNATWAFGGRATFGLPEL